MTWLYGWHGYGDDTAIGVTWLGDPPAPGLGASDPRSRRPYSAVPFPSNSELWRNFPLMRRNNLDDNKALRPGRAFHANVTQGLFSLAWREMLPGTRLANKTCQQDSLTRLAHGICNCWLAVPAI